MRLLRTVHLALIATLWVSTQAAAQQAFDAQRMMEEQAAATRRADDDAEKKRKADVAKAAAKHPCKIKGGVSVGMTKAQVYASCWGKPEKVNVTTTASGDHEQYVYPGYQYLYLRNGIVTSIQTSR